MLSVSDALLRYHAEALSAQRKKKRVSDAHYTDKKQGGRPGWAARRGYVCCDKLFADEFFGNFVAAANDIDTVVGVSDFNALEVVVNSGSVFFVNNNVGYTR